MILQFCFLIYIIVLYNIHYIHSYSLHIFPFYLLILYN
nr:MAG TPA: hypothetical protein [Herelleviridae sp.]